MKLACSPHEETDDAEKPFQRRADHSLPGSALRSNVTRGGILKEHQAGISAKELCRKHGVSDGTFYRWRSKYGGMEVSEARRLKALEAENAKLKKMLAEQMLDVAMLKEMLGKTSEARCKATRCGPGHDRETLQPAAGLRPGRDRSACVSAWINQTCRHRTAREAKGAFQRTA